jgi:hypothetical protein
MGTVAPLYNRFEGGEKGANQANVELLVERDEEREDELDELVARVLGGQV